MLGLASVRNEQPPCHLYLAMSRCTGDSPTARRRLWASSVKGDGCRSILRCHSPLVTFEACHNLEVNERVTGYHYHDNV